MPNQQTRTIRIFRTGQHTDMHGTTRVFSASDLDAMVARYDPKHHQAPLVIGHPASDSPAWGWVQSLSRDGDALYAHLEQLSPDVVEMVRDGRFKHVSAAFYPPKSPGNPQSSGYGLRHVGLLGAQPPAVKGLGQVSFGVGDETVVEIPCGPEVAFHDPNPVCERNNLMPQPTQKTDAPRNEDPPLPRGDLMSRLESEDRKSEQERTARCAEFSEAERLHRELTSRLADLDERERKLKQAENEQRQQLHADFAEEQVKAGRILPREKERCVAMLVAMDGLSGALSFAEEGKATQEPPVDALKKFLAGLPERVDYAERSAPEQGAPSRGRGVTVPAGYTATQESLALHGKILRYQEDHKTDYLTAALAVNV